MGRKTRGRVPSQKKGKKKGTSSLSTNPILGKKKDLDVPKVRKKGKGNGRPHQKGRDVFFLAPKTRKTIGYSRKKKRKPGTNPRLGTTKKKGGNLDPRNRRPRKKREGASPSWRRETTTSTPEKGKKKKGGLAHAPAWNREEKKKEREKEVQLQRIKKRKGKKKGDSLMPNRGAKRGTMARGEGERKILSETTERKRGGEKRGVTYYERGEKKEKKKRDYLIP